MGQRCGSSFPGQWGAGSGVFLLLPAVAFEREIAGFHGGTGLYTRGSSPKKQRPAGPKSFETDGIPRPPPTDGKHRGSGGLFLPPPHKSQGTAGCALVTSPKKNRAVYCNFPIFSPTDNFLLHIKRIIDIIITARPETVPIIVPIVFPATLLIPAKF